MLFRSLVYGLAAHFLLGWALFFFLKPVKHRKNPLPVAVEINLVDKPKPSVPALSTPAASGPATRRSSSSSEPPQQPSTGKVVGGYSDFLPKAAQGHITLPDAHGSREPSLIEGHQFKEGSSGVTRQNLMIDASSLSAAFDVPLKARRLSTGREAFLRIVKDGANGLRISDLRGDPMLRAVVFEYLHEGRVQRLMLKLMQELEEDSLPLTLQSTVSAADRMQDESDFSWMGRRLIIRKSAPPQSRGPGIALPDEDAKKAIIRDRLEFERFQRSPAYRSVIQNYVLPFSK